MPGDDRPQDAALLIDWENLKFSLMQRGMRPNVSALRDKAESFGRVVVARAYADWQDGYHTQDPRNLYAGGIEPVYVPTRAYYEEEGEEKRKNSVDVKLTADCIELCHTFPNIGTYVLVTGDQDFLHVVNTLRPYGKRVIIIGVSWTTSARLAERVDDVIYYDRDVDPAPAPPQYEPAPPTAEPTIDDITWAAADVARASGLADDLQPELEGILRDIVAIVKEYRGRGQQLLLSSLGMELSKRKNAQIFSMIVKGRLKQMVAALDQQGLIRVVNQGLVDWLYLPGEAVTLSSGHEPEHDARTPSEDERFIELPAPQRHEVIRAIRAARLQPGITFLTFNRICEVVAQTAVGQRLGGETRRFVNSMLADGVLTRDQVQEGFDPTTGNRYTFPSFRLNAQHECVRDCP
jgi:uncharacterized LabA/DUF88 family protein